MRRMNRIREFRERSGLTGEELAERIGTSSAQIYKLETGQRRLTQAWLEKLADALGCRAVDLIENVPRFGPDDVADMLNELDPAIGMAMVAGRMTPYRVTGDSVAYMGVVEGQTIVINSSPEAIANLKTNDIVLAQLQQPRMRALRVAYVGPRLTVLLTWKNPPISVIPLDDPTIRPKILGVMVKPEKPPIPPKT
jgi:transcriptional regulator with XRE-family HTH domain